MSDEQSHPLPPDIVISCEIPRQQCEAHSTEANHGPDPSAQEAADTRLHSARNADLLTLEDDLLLQIKNHFSLAINATEKPSCISCSELYGMLDVTTAYIQSMDTLEPIMHLISSLMTNLLKMCINEHSFVEVSKQMLIMLDITCKKEYLDGIRILASEEYIAYFEQIAVEGEAQQKELMLQCIVQAFNNARREDFVKILTQTQQKGRLVGTLTIMYNDMIRVTKHYSESFEMHAQNMIRCISYCRPSLAKTLVNTEVYRMWIIDMKAIISADPLPLPEDILSRLSIMHSLIEQEDINGMIEIGLPEVIVSTLQQFYHNPKISNLCCSLLLDLAVDEKVMDFYRSSNVSFTLHKLLEISLNAQTYEYDLLSACVRLCQMILQTEDSNAQEFLSFCAIINALMSQYRDKGPLHNVCIQAIMNVLPWIDDGLDIIVKYDCQVPLTTAMFGTLLMHGHKAQILCTVCRCLIFIFTHPAMRDKFGNKNVHLALQSYLTEPNIDNLVPLDLIYRTLTALCAKSTANADKVATDGIINNLDITLNKALDYDHLQQTMLGFLEALCTYSHVPFPLNVIRDMIKFIEGSLLAKQIQESKCLLCLNAHQSIQTKELHSRWIKNKKRNKLIIGLVLDCMDNFKESVLIQHKCVRLLQYELSECIFEASNLLCQQAIESITVALFIHSMNRDLRLECYILIYLLSKHSVFLSQVIVDSPVVDYLCETSKDVETDNASNLCLYLLGCHRNNLSKILIRAAKLNQSVTAMAMIELGANVNASIAIDTPLAHACRHGNEALIREVLSKGVVDVAIGLSIAVEMKHHEVVGILLRHVNENHFENQMVNCGSFDLPSIRAEWLKPLFEEPEKSVPTKNEQKSVRAKAHAKAQAIRAAGQSFFAKTPSLETCLSFPGCSTMESHNHGVFTQCHFHPEDPRLWEQWQFLHVTNSELDLALSTTGDRTQYTSLNLRHWNRQDECFKEGSSLEISTSDTQHSATEHEIRQPSERHVISLDLSNNRIMDISALAHLAEERSNPLQNIHHVYLAKNSVKLLPTTLSQILPALTYLDLKSNKIGTFPTCIFHCANIQHLDLSHNKIAECEFEMRLDFPECNSLRELDISDNLLTEFPFEICDVMKGITHLDLSRNEICKLPEQAIDLPLLNELNLQHNKLKALPDTTLLKCIILKKIDLEHNELETLPHVECAQNLSELECINVNRNKLVVDRANEEFPAFILALPRLKILKINHNGLSYFPHAYKFKSSEIAEIHVAHNKLRRFAIGSQSLMYKRLLELNLSHNNLVEIPRELGRIASLTSLDISHNPRLTTLPDELGNLQRLWELNLDGLQLNLDQSILSGRARDVISYLHEKLKRSVEYNYLKLMVVGYGGRGKTTLVHSLMRIKHKGPKLPTVGVDVRQWRFMGLRNMKLVTYSLSVWDFAGQEDFYASHNCFLSKRALYLVVYDLSRGKLEVEKLQTWLNTIQAHAPACPVVVIGTHLDRIKLSGRQKVTTEFRSTLKNIARRPGFPYIRGITEVDCTSENYGMEELRIMIKDVLDDFKMNGQPVIFQKIPASFMKLQELFARELSNIQGSLPVIRHQRVLHILRKGRLDLDHNELQQAVKFLHNAGVIMHYEDPTLKLEDFYFLDPQWLCKMMAQIVTVREINPFVTREGTMRRRDVELLCCGKITKDYVFPTSLIPQYIRLMTRFEVLLPINEFELLIPSRLPNERPAFKLPLKSGESKVQRNYRMAYHPIGLWSRLIIRLHTFSSQMLLGFQEPELLFWKEGIYIFFSENAFLLIESTDSTTLCITVPPSQNGTRLLSCAVDNVDTVIEEWFPGLLETSPTGQPHLLVTIPCLLCDEDNVFQFELYDLIQQSSTDDVIDCPRHGGKVALRLLVPDVLMADLEPDLHVNQNELKWLSRSDTLLGDGSFGKVYKANYGGVIVAAKLFLAVDELPVHKRIRHEVNILRRLNHPCLIKMLGVDVRSGIIILEIAPHGSLRSVLNKHAHIHKVIKHRMALQIAEGLLHLHKCSIIFRDLKPDNLLVFSLQQSTVINVKISDYGIAKLATFSGLQSSEGTPGYRAPEVIKGEAHSKSADVFSFGAVLYELLTNGTHPFESSETGNRVEDAILQGITTSHQVHDLNELSELAQQCLSVTPEERPSTKDIVVQLRNPISICRRQTCLISKGSSADIMLSIKQGRENMIVVSNNNCFSELSQLSILSPALASNVQGILLRDGLILAMVALGPNHLLISTDQQKLQALHIPDLTPIGDPLDITEDTMICMHRCKGSDFDYIAGGTEGGFIYLMDTVKLFNYLDLDKTMRPNSITDRYQRIQIGDGKEKVNCVSTYSHGGIYVAAGTRVHHLKILPVLEINFAFDTSIRGDTRAVSKILRARGYLHIIKKWSPNLQKWSVKRAPKLISARDVSFYVESWSINVQNSYDCRVLGSCIVNSNIWLGLANGFLCIINPMDYSCLTVLDTGYLHLKSIITINDNDKDIVAISCCSKEMNDRHDGGYTSDERSSNIVFLDSELAKQQRALSEYLDSFDALFCGN